MKDEKFFFRKMYPLSPIGFEGRPGHTWRVCVARLNDIHWFGEHHPIVGRYPTTKEFETFMSILREYCPNFRHGIFGGAALVSFKTEEENGTFIICADGGIFDR